MIQEYESIIKSEIPTYKEIQKLEFLESCIKEAMRLYPVVPLIARDIKHSIQISSKKMVFEWHRFLKRGKQI